jgi:putative transposase
MKRSRFTEDMIIGILKEQEAGVPVADLCQKHGVSNASIYKWKAKYAGMDVSEAKRLKGLEDENARLKKLLADAMLDNSALKDLLRKMVTPAAERDAVAHLQTAYRMSERRACQLLGCCRMTMRYQAIRVDDGELREQMKTERRRFGYRRLLRREGHVVSRPHSRLGWLTPAEYANTFNPQRDLALRSMASSAPAPVAHPAQMGEMACCRFFGHEVKLT